MKSKYLIFGLLILLIACKKNETVSLDNLLKTEKDSLVIKDEKFDKTNFKDRAEELIYIREYLKYKLPLIIIKQNPDLVKKAQYELISNGENPTLVDAALRTRKYESMYKNSMWKIIDGNYGFKEVKNQLENKGEIDFSYPNEVETNYKDYYQEERENNDSIDEPIVKKPIVAKNTNDALANILKGSESDNGDSKNKVVGSASGSGVGNGSGSNNGYSLEGRKTIIKPSPEYKCNEEGKVVVQIVVDKSGSVLEAKTGVRGTTNMSKCLLDACKEAALKSKWQPDENAPEKQTGTIVYNFRIN